MENEIAPQYLYKILSTENWEKSQKTESIKLSEDDDKFIHLSTNEQLDSILTKYWSDVPTFVILKLDAKKLPGTLLFEANPGGINKYYHLYDGFIPSYAIVELRKVERPPIASENARKHTIHLIGEPSLRTPARLLSKEEILTPEIQTLIQEMKEIMQAAPGVGLAAPQIGIPLQIIVIEDRSEYHTHLTPEQLAERGRSVVPFHVLINPTLFIEEGETAEFFEGCLSVPAVVGIVPRAKKVRVEGYNEMAQPIVIEATDWYARILQHEIDHLKGILFIDRAECRTLTTAENFVKLWKQKPIKEVQRVLSQGVSDH